MNLAFRFLLSSEATPRKNEHKLRPYAHWFSHQRNNDTLFREVAFPDAVPRITSNFHLAEADFLSLPVPSLDQPNDPDTSFWMKSDVSKRRSTGYDYIVTLFFIDTSTNVFATIEHIYTLLRPGGTWINLGPLLWTSGGAAKLELSLNEVIMVAEEIGFIIQDGSPGDVMARKTIECEYTGDISAMMRWTYVTEFWVATKSK